MLSEDPSRVTFLTPSVRAASRSKALNRVCLGCLRASVLNKAEGADNVAETGTHDSLWARLFSTQAGSPGTVLLAVDCGSAGFSCIGRRRQSETGKHSLAHN